MMHKGKKGPYSMLRRFDRMAIGLFLLIAFGLFLAVNLEMRRLAQVEAKERAELILGQTLASYQALSRFGGSPGASQTMIGLLEEVQGRMPAEGILDIAIANSSDESLQPDPVEQRLLDQIAKGNAPRSTASLRRIDGQHFYAIMQPGPELDGQPSLLSMQIPLEKIHQKANQDSLRMMLLILSALGMLYMLHKVMVGKYIAAPLYQLRNLAYRIQHAETLPDEPFAKPREMELWETIGAFNRLAGKEEKGEE
jgi:hypothetical protein